MRTPGGGEKLYSSTLSLISALYGGEWPRPLTGCFTTGKGSRYPLYRRQVGPLGYGWKNLTSTGILHPDLPVRNESLYRLSYLGPQYIFLYIYSGPGYIYIYIFFKCIMNRHHQQQQQEVISRFRASPVFMEISPSIFPLVDLRFLYR